MQRLATILPARAAAMTCGATSMAQRFVNKKAAEKYTKEGNNRWLEAEIDENINTPEERYAHEREVALLRKLVQDVEKSHTQKMETMKADRDKEVASLKKQMDELERRINSIKDTK